MYAGVDIAVRRILRRYFADAGQTEIVIAVILFILILMLAGRRVVVQ